MIYLIYYKIPQNIFRKTHGFDFMQNQHNASYSKTYNFWFGLYAWTTNKKLAQRFKGTRNMKYFEIKEKDIRKKELRKLIKEDRGMKVLELIEKPLTGFMKQEPVSLKIPITKEEYTLSSRYDETLLAEYFGTIFNNPITYPTLFNSDIITALSYLGFFEIYGMISHDAASDNGDISDIYDIITTTTQWNASYNLDYSGLYSARNSRIAPIDVFMLLFGELVKMEKK